MTLLRFTILTAMLAGAVSLTAMDHNTKKDFSVCQQLKTIAPDAPQKNYDTLAAKLKEQDLTTCDCIKHILAARKQRAFRAAQQEIGFTDQEWQQLFPAFLRILQYNRWKRPEITCESTISPTLCQELKAMIRSHDLREPITIREHKITGIGVTDKLDGSFLLINNQFKQSSNQAQQGTIAHEIYHRKQKHQEERMCLSLLDLKYNKASWWSTWWLPTLKSKKKTAAIAKYSRSQEAEADRLPAAYDHIDVAQNLEILYKELLKNENLFAWAYRKIDDLATVFSNDHPSHEKRLAWATRIRRMREIEEQHRKKAEAEQQRITTALDHQIALHSPF